jgi:hypothetical protein
MSKVISSAIAVLLLFLLLVPAACTVGPSESPDIDDAIDVVVKDVLPTIAEIQAGGPYWCLKLDDPLPSGTIIEEDSGSTLKITLSEELFFFYVDLAPGSFYAHPVKYILVDKHGDHEIYDAQWWPRIDGVIPQELVKVPPDEEDIVDNNVEWVSPLGAIAEYVSAAYIYNKWSEGFIVVQGVMPDEALYDASVDTYINVVDFFYAIKNAYSEVDGLVQSEAADVFDLIDIMANEKRSVITIYIVAHGNVNYVRLGGQSFYASYFCNKMAAHPDILFNFVLCSCRSGSFVNALRTLPNVRVVLTCCADDERAWPDYDYISGALWMFPGSGEYDINPSDVGSEWTSSLIEAGLEIVVDADKLTTIESMATEFGAPVTSVLLCEAGYGAVGINPGLGLSQDFDLCHRVGYSSPQVYCSFEPLG